MQGIVLAAGGGTRLRPLTERLPKTLLEVDGSRSILELAVANLRSIDVTEIVVVTGHAAETIDELRPTLERRYGVALRLTFNDHYADWNNAYSLWLAREAFKEGAVLVNGDTVHPPSVEERLLASRGAAPIVLAIDDAKTLGDEEMKVGLDDDGRMTAINKALAPASAQGEYIGVTLIEPDAAGALDDALSATFERDTTLYYEDGYQEYVDRGETILTASIGVVDWVEVDNHDDLSRAREIACHF